MQYAFEQGLVHRDIKPANLFVGLDGEHVRILDIGLARLEWAYQYWPGEEAPAGGLGVMGTPDYISPEQSTSPHAADIRADIYSLGATFYHLLTGQPPFPGNSLPRKLLHHQQTPPPSARQIRPDVPPELAQVIQKMMAKSPDDRFKTPAHVAVALVPFCQGGEARASVRKYRPPDDPDDRALNYLLRHREPAAAPEVAPAPRPAPAAARPPAGVPYGTPGYPERRAHPRRAGNSIPVYLRASEEQEEQLRGWVLNRSAGGLGLLVEDALEIGTVVLVSPDAPEGGVQRCAEVRVVYCYVERIRWRVGVEFVRKLSWDDLRLFG
jgi:hypothetical protein